MIFKKFGFTTNNLKACLLFYDEESILRNMLNFWIKEGFKSSI